MDIKSYIKQDNTLDYQKIYEEMYKITGFMSKERQQRHYDNVVDLYNTWKKGKELYEQGEKADPNETPF